jgi:excisionase family DNA binding protein
MDRKSSEMIDLENDPELMTAAEISKVFNVSLGHVYHLIERKELPIVKIGRSVRVRKVDLEKYINDHYHSRIILK